MAHTIRIEELPPGWGVAVHNGRPYYVNYTTGKTQWELPGGGSTTYYWTTTGTEIPMPLQRLSLQRQSLMMQLFKDSTVVTIGTVRPTVILTVSILKEASNGRKRKRETGCFCGGRSPRWSPCKQRRDFDYYYCDEWEEDGEEYDDDFSDSDGYYSDEFDDCYSDYDDDGYYDDY